jgi:hypothetical protein
MPLLRAKSIAVLCLGVPFFCVLGIPPAEAWLFSRPKASQYTSFSSFSNHWLATSSGDNHGQSSNETMVTKEMFLRSSSLEDPSTDATTPSPDSDNTPSATVKRKTKKTHSSQQTYKVLDNRDQLPFAVTVATPDPYTHSDVKNKAARQRSTQHGPKKRAADNNAATNNTIASSVFNIMDAGKTNTNNNNNNVQHTNTKNEVDSSTWLGDFVLDKYTTTGDYLSVGDQQYKVVRHTCQYKYAGGQRFVMVRKILQVKEVGRLLTEEYLAAQFNRESGNSNDSFPSEEA